MAFAVTRCIGAALWAAHGLRMALTAPRYRACTLKERLAMIPTAGLPVTERVSIYWDAHQVPFIEAARDEDLAVALGVVHAHLRLGQIELLRRVSRGRLAEMIGPLALGADHALRILDYGRAATASLAMLPAATRRWLEGYVAGINAYIARAETLPPEFELLGVEPEPWRVEDTLTLGRLIASDVSWLVWLRLLEQRAAGDWPAAWRRLVESAITPALDTQAMPARRALLETALLAASRSGSNALALAAARSASGAPMIAADPHLSLAQPNLWLIAGYRSPSHHAIGLMIPGLPFIAIGRNPWIAWAGTNLHAASSELVDVSSLPRDAFQVRAERIAVRWGRPHSVAIRETAFGPIITDAAPLRWHGPEILALQWIGHRASDEITAMLRVGQARDYDEFRAALGGFAVPGLTMLCAERSGRIGQVTAAHLPARALTLPQQPFPQPSKLTPWKRILTAGELPGRVDPPEGYLVSANERPRRADILMGLFFSPDDRWRRLAQLIEADEKLDARDLVGLLLDVYHQPAAELLARLRDALRGLSSTPHEGSAQQQLLAALTAWDGRYRAASAGALAFELLLYYLTRALVPRAKRRLYDTGWQARALLSHDMMAAAPMDLIEALRKSLPRAARRFRRFQSWGALHRLRLAHPLAATPWVGRRFLYGDFPADGSSETVMKTAHSLTNRRHAASYGSTARVICDLSDDDRNHIVLLGGQDGWVGSATAGDQVTLWRNNAFIDVPLRLETVRARARHVTELVA
ncbi:MAG TPA: penicillin acylase family protein [Alphaproteobacteria bacterium]|nr:penicillin acylase family protein [Alphaproteobacteria bacterium]